MSGSAARVGLPERRLHLSRIHVQDDDQRHDRGGESDAGAGGLEEPEEGLEQREPGDDDREQPRPGLERPEAEGRREPGDAGADGQPTPEAALLERLEVAKDPEPVEAEDPQAEVQPVAARP